MSTVSGSTILCAAIDSEGEERERERERERESLSTCVVYAYLMGLYLYQVRPDSPRFAQILKSMKF